MEYVKLGDIVDIKTGKLNANEGVEGGKYPFFTCSVKPLAIDTYSYDCECVLVAGNGDLNVKYYSGKFDAYQRTYIIESKDKLKLDNKYLYYFLSKYVDVLRNDAIGGVIKYIKLNNLTDAILPLPTLDTQYKIAEVLDKAQELIDKRKEQIEALDELVKSRFIDMFGDKNKFEYVKIEDLVKNRSDIVDGPFGSNLKTVDYVDSGVRVIQINNIGECEFRDKNKKYVTEEKFNSLIKHSVIPGDIVVAKMGEPIGRACILPSNIEKAIIVADCMKIRPNTDIVNTKYLEFLLNSEEVKSQFKKYSQGSTRVRLNLTMLRQVRVLYPDIDLQNQFADFANQVDKLKSQMETSLKELEDNFNSLMQKAFKGELF